MYYAIDMYVFPNGVKGIILQDVFHVCMQTQMPTKNTFSICNAT